LSRADVFRGRIRKQQHWHFLSYVNDLSTAGIAVSKDEKYHSAPTYKRTMRILKIWQANQKYAKRKQIAEKIASKTHASKKRVIQNMPYIQNMFRNKKMAEAIAKDLELEREEVDWLKAS
jgi:replication factor C large subunit